jgi:regulatory protein
MKVTAITAQQKDKNRVNVMVDGSYRFSLDVFQVGELGIRVGKEYTDAELNELENESIFGKLYARALEYCMMRLHSAKEIKDYLWRKTRDTRTKEGKVRKGAPVVLTERVFDRLSEKGYIDDKRFARQWVENRHAIKGASKRKLSNELRTKGVESVIIETVLAETDRDEMSELEKVIAKKGSRYNDEQKLMQYLARQGFSYDDIKQALSNSKD